MLERYSKESRGCTKDTSKGTTLRHLSREALMDLRAIYPAEGSKGESIANRKKTEAYQAMSPWRWAGLRLLVRPSPNSK